MRREKGEFVAATRLDPSRVAVARPARLIGRELPLPVLSGCPADCREATEDWLPDACGIAPVCLLMRPSGDQRPNQAVERRAAGSRSRAGAPRGR